MSINLVAVCDKEVVAKQLEQTCDKLGYDITCEIQQENEIINKLSDEALDKSNAILLVTQKKLNKLKIWIDLNTATIIKFFLYLSCKIQKLS